jgi:branched-chain amino acid transport system permease protein
MLDILGYGAFFLTTALTYALICIGLNVQWGMTGLFNVGVAGFVAIGAYVSALLTTPAAAGRFGGFDLPILIGWCAGAGAAALAAAAIGAVTLRLRADYLAITTFGIAVTIQLVALNAQSLTGGPFGIGFIPRPFASWASHPALFDSAHLLLTGAVVAAVFLAIERLARSPWGRVLRAIREDETAAASLGKSPRRYRLQAFALGGAVMGLAGAIQAHFIGFIAPDNYVSSLTFLVWTMLVVGGSGNNKGAVLGAILVWGLWSASGYLAATLLPADLQARGAALQIVGIGVVLALILLLRPRGLIGEERVVSRHIEPGAS